MLRSMYAGVSGLDAHQQMMDVIGNNIANVNTVGFKRSRVTFQEMLTQTMQGASASQDNRAGTNAKQVGLGTSVGSIDNDMTSGNLESTGKESDVAIQGDGFFVLRDGASNSYTRAGNFGFDEAGNLYSLSTGMLAQGWVAEQGEFGEVTETTMEDIVLDKEINAKATNLIEYGKNLSASVPNYLDTASNTLNLSGGTPPVSDTLTFDMEKSAAENIWNFTLDAADSSTDIAGAGASLSGDIEINDDGEITAFETTSLATNLDLLDSTNDLTIDLKGTGEEVDLDLISTGEAVNEELLLSHSSSDQSVQLDFSADSKRTIETEVYDSQGAEHSVKFDLVKKENNKWEIAENSISVSDSTNLSNSVHEITFDANGNIKSGESLEITFEPDGLDGTSNETQTVTMDFSQLTQFASPMTATTTNVNGNSDGALEAFSFTESGNIIGSYDNGLSQTVAKIALANFSNPSGLTRKEGVFEESANSGDPDIGAAAVGGRGSLAPSNLEMSNANLSKEFTKMITAQRGFQANAKVITTSDEMLQELTNLKR